MVKHSLRNMIEKYPYFLDKRPSSNFYKITDVYNENFKLMYNDLFRVYESQHLNKGMLIWKEQVKPYDYNIEFRCGFKDIKSVKIYKNNTLIHMEEYLEEESKTDFSFTYTCKYVKTNMIPLKIYKCTHCDEIYMDESIPSKCDKCINKTYTLVKAYKCNECGEVYFTSQPPTECKNHCTNTYTQLYPFKCVHCGEVYLDEEPPAECTCGFQTVENTKLYYNDRIVVIDNSTNYDVIPKIVLVNDIVEFELSDIYVCENCGEVYFGDNPPDECTECNKRLIQVKKAYRCDECGEIYFTEEPPTECVNGCNTIFTQHYVYNHNEESIFLVKDETELNQIDTSLLIDEYTSTDVTNNESQLPNIYVCENCGEVYFGNNSLEKCSKCNNDLAKVKKAYRCDECGEIYFTEEPPTECVNNCSSIFKHYYVFNYEGKIFFIKEGTKLSQIDVNWFVDEYTSTDEIILDEGNDFRVPFPIITEDKFLMIVETYDEYCLSKGFPENDVALGDDYDHDYSLDAIGALNNIPRKEYLKIYSEELYPYTEPPYNNKLTEDDYHYMMRMIIYNLLLWEESPPVAEIWKLYGVNARLENREKYLLKLFDENRHPFNKETGLVQCWTPEEWEHKDRFCDGTISLGEYFFVKANTIRPVKYQDVRFDFIIRNSLAEIIDTIYTVDITLTYGDSTNTKEIKTNYSKSGIIVSHTFLNSDEPNVFHFKAKNSKGEVFGETDIIVNVRDCDDADWYVDSQTNNVSQTGSLTNPFSSLEQALEVCNENRNLIVLLSDEEITSPLTVNQSCAIMGDCEGEVGITNSNVNQFFSLTGGKNVDLMLVNLDLAYKQINSHIHINSWNNQNKEFGDTETVIIHGGRVIITLTFNQDKYYPFDFVHVQANLKNNEGEILSDNVVHFFDEDKYVKSLTSDNEGNCDFWWRVNKSTDKATLKVKNESDIYFESEFDKKIDLSLPRNTYEVYYNDSVTLRSNKYTPNSTMKLYQVNDDSQIFVTELESNSQGEVSYNYIPEWGQSIFFTPKGDLSISSVLEEFVVTTKVPISDVPMPSEGFITNFKVDNKGIISYDKTVITPSKLSDFNGVLLDFKVDRKGRWVVETFKADTSREDSQDLLSYEAEELSKAIYKLTFDNTTMDIKGERLGVFWE